MPEELDGDPTPSASQPAPAAAAAPASIGLPADLVRNSPEFLALQAQNRELARKAGTAEAAIAAARAEAENIRQAAEAERARALNEQLASTLGEDGLAFWQRFADLSSTDPLAAARELQAYRGGAQSPAPGTATTSPTQGQQQTGAAMPANGTGARPPIASSMHADLPLGSIAPQDSDADLMAALDARFNEIAERNNNVSTRNRVTAKEREEGIMAHFTKGVITKLRESGAR